MWETKKEHHVIAAFPARGNQNASTWNCLARCWCVVFMPRHRELSMLVRRALGGYVFLGSTRFYSIENPYPKISVKRSARLPDTKCASDRAIYRNISVPIHSPIVFPSNSKVRDAWDSNPRTNSTTCSIPGISSSIRG